MSAKVLDLSEEIEGRKKIGANSYKIVLEPKKESI